MLAVKEVFATMQGEGVNAGRPAVFVRFAGCNLWSGKDVGRESGAGACARWCDTDFVGGDKYQPRDLLDKVADLAGGKPDGQYMRHERPLVVLTGGEPVLQLRSSDGADFVALLLHYGFHPAVETNGTVDAPVLTNRDVHVCVSPKAMANDTLSTGHIAVRRGAELKVVVPQWSSAALAVMSTWDFDRFYVQALDDGHGGVNVTKALAAARVLGWRVSVQMHKLVGLP